MRITSVATIAVLTALNAPSPSLAGPAELEEIRTACVDKMLLTAAQCACFLEQATPLTDAQQAYVAATFATDDERAAALTATLSVEDRVIAARFIPTHLLACTT